MSVQSFTHAASFELDADPARIFRALTLPEELERWFAEHAEVAPHVGGDYRFYGKATLGNPGAAEATQKISAYEPGSKLAYRWTVLGAASEVTLTLHPGSAEGRTRVHVAHEIAGALPFARPEHAIDDLWRIHMGNLLDHLAGKHRPVLPDFAVDKPEVRLSVEIDAPPAKVYRCLVEPELMNRWLWGATAKVDLAAGTYGYGWNHGPTRILERVPDQLLVTDWTDWRNDPDKPSTRVSWKLEPLASGQKTRLTLVHDGFPHAVDRSDYLQGWAGFAEALAEVALTA
jgi:uncharacterized protein YndB with AHSA1/START domain